MQGEAPGAFGGFPRPGKALRAVLAVVAIVSIAMAVIVNWAPGGETGVALFEKLTFSPKAVLAGQVWRPFTATLLTSPRGFGHVVFTLIGLYFLSTDLEKRWGAWPYLRFLGLSALFGWLFALLGDLVPVATPILHREMLFGASAAITATAIAWSRENAELRVRLFFFLPVSGRQLFWVTIGFCILNVVYFQDVAEGAIAPFGGIVAGLLFSGQPSLARRAWLKLRLAMLRRRAGGLSAEDMLGDEGGAPARKRRPGAPPLRVVIGGLDEDLKKRKVPKDKRHLN